MLQAEDGIADPLAKNERFGLDTGTLWLSDESQSLTSVRGDKWTWASRRRMRRITRARPIIWFADDEVSNRKWFAEQHRAHFAVVTFSSRKALHGELELGAPCDVVVTDIFFPALPIPSAEAASALLGIYDTLASTLVRDLPKLWQDERNRWALAGFDIAVDVAEEAAKRKEKIPVLLFSRKAVLLLGADDWSTMPDPTIENTFWMLEKVDPESGADVARKAASVQRARINATLQYRVLAIRWWRRILGRFSIGFGFVSYNLGTS